MPRKNRKTKACVSKLLGAGTYYFKNRLKAFTISQLDAILFYNIVIGKFNAIAPHIQQPPLVLPSQSQAIETVKYIIFQKGSNRLQNITL
jgi:hypothetical protein